MRHQLAQLLTARGFQVIFFEKPRYLFQTLSPARSVQRNLYVMQYKELVHHKLRLTARLQLLNASTTTRSIRASLDEHEVCKEDVIINFNYEYFFLRRLFPSNIIVTLINDDFTSTAILGYQKPLLWALRKTLAMSDAVFAVSVPLQRLLSRYKETALFLPWADQEYVKPETRKNRDTILFWGYVNGRLDFELVEQLLIQASSKDPHMRIQFVGPLDAKAKRVMSRLQTFRNCEYLGAATLRQLDVDRMIGGIMPYRTNLPEIDVCTLPNKALQLLARGLPLLISGMPNFIQRPFVIPLVRDDPYSSVEETRNRFDSVQCSIEEFVSANTAAARLKQLSDRIGLS